MNKQNGISSVIKIRNIQQAAVQIELQKLDSGKLQEETKQFTLTIFL
jgi:hypothetical protein